MNCSYFCTLTRFVTLNLHFSPSLGNYIFKNVFLTTFKKEKSVSLTECKKQYLAQFPIEFLFFFDASQENSAIPLVLSAFVSNMLPPERCIKLRSWCFRVFSCLELQILPRFFHKSVLKAHEPHGQVVIVMDPLLSPIFQICYFVYCCGNLREEKFILVCDLRVCSIGSA